MRCFELTERAVSGLRIARFPEPHIPIKGREPLLLDPKLTDFIQGIPRNLKGDLLLHAANLLFHGNTVRVAPEPPEWKDSRALVRVATETMGGSISLSANCFTEELRNGRVVQQWRPFPSVGIKVVLGSPEPIAVEYGSGLELLLIMEEGASFRISRTGALQGGSPEIFVQWHKDKLAVRVPHRFRSLHRPEGEHTLRPSTRRAATG